MTDKKEIVVVGAGPAGLVAAINLNREGLDVTVREKQDSVGGDPGWHPSVHTTPVGTDLWDYIGIDCSEAFVDSTDVFKIYVKGKLVKGMNSLIASDGINNTERGHRESSLDSVLFRIAEKEGVNFEFNKPFTKDDFKNASRGTIIATGLSPGIYDWLGLEYSKFSGYWAYSEVDKDLITNSFYFGTFSNEYGYACAMNGIWYVLLFARKEIPQENLDFFKNELERIEGRTFGKWRRFLGHTPKGPRLFLNDKFILTGTMAGVVEPAYGGGITGALLSGKIAAIAVTDPQKARAEFKHFTDGIITHIARKRRRKSKGLPPQMAPLRLGNIWFKIK